MPLKTHLGIREVLSGRVTELGEGRATVVMRTIVDMVADERGLVHGGFVFGAADYAAMCAVNDPHVVLGASDCRFVAPVVVGQTVTCRARRTAVKGRKHTVEVEASVEGTVVMTGTLTAFVLDNHVLGPDPNSTTP